VREGYKVAIDVDLSKFFDKINHDLLMHLMARRIRDKTLLCLIGRYLWAGVKDKNQFHPSTIGAPQGGPLSPLLSNIILDVLDKELEKRGHKFVDRQGWRSKCGEPTVGALGEAYWRSAKTKGIQIALNDEWLKKQGLISLRNCWILFTHHSRTAHCGSA